MHWVWQHTIMGHYISALGWNWFVIALLFFSAQYCLHFFCLTSWASYENLKSLLFVYYVWFQFYQFLKFTLYTMYLWSIWTFISVLNSCPLHHKFIPSIFPLHFIFSLTVFILQYLYASSVVHPCLFLHSCTLVFSSCCSASGKLTFKYSIVVFFHSWFLGQMAAVTENLPGGTDKLSFGNGLRENVAWGENQLVLMWLVCTGL